MAEMNTTANPWIFYVITININLLVDFFTITNAHYFYNKDKIITQILLKKPKQFGPSKFCQKIRTIQDIILLQFPLKSQTTVFACD